MSKKFILGVSFFVFLFGFKIAKADVFISEIKYSPTTNQWVEVYNDTDSDVDITNYKILDNSVKNGHGISALDGGSNIISSHSFGVVAKVPSDFSGSSFPVFKSSLNIKVSSDSVALVDNSGNDSASININGSAVGGNSLQLVNGSWQPGVPTPGAENTNLVVDNPTDNSDTTDTGNDSDSDSTNTNTNSNITSGGGGSVSINSSTTKTKKKVVENPTMKATITANKISFSGQPLNIQTNILGYSNEKVVLGKADWNFGDGSSYEQVNNFAKFQHTYFYPGEYQLYLEYYNNSFADTPDAVDKMVIKVLPTTVFVSKVGNAKDFFIELTNNASSDIDISGWQIRANNKIFVFPKNSLILAKDKMTIPGKITGFVPSDQNDLKIYSATGDLIFDYNYSSASIPRVNINYTAPKISDTLPVINSMKEENQNQEAENKNINLNSSVSENDLPVEAMVGDSTATTNSNYLFSGIFLVLVATACIGVYFIRRKKSICKAIGDDFEILDE